MAVGAGRWAGLGGVLSGFEYRAYGIGVVHWAGGVVGEFDDGAEATLDTLELFDHGADVLELVVDEHPQVLARALSDGVERYQFADGVEGEADIAGGGDGP